MMTVHYHELRFWLFLREGHAIQAADNIPMNKTNSQEERRVYLRSKDHVLPPAIFPGVISSSHTLVVFFQSYQFCSVVGTAHSSTELSEI